MPEPIKRHTALQPLSREHHHGLLLSWKIREGLKLNIELERIIKYADWFWENHLSTHFKFEEEFVFPLLGHDHKFTKRALNEHERLRSLFANPDKTQQDLTFIEEELVAHIRFEERILFKEVEQIANEEQLKTVEIEHSKNAVKVWPDEFWVSKLK